MNVECFLLEALTPLTKESQWGDGCVVSILVQTSLTGSMPRLRLTSAEGWLMQKKLLKA